MTCDAVPNGAASIAAEEYLHSLERRGIKTAGQLQRSFLFEHCDFVQDALSEQLWILAICRSGLQSVSLNKMIVRSRARALERSNIISNGFHDPGDDFILAERFRIDAVCGFELRAVASCFVCALGCIVENNSVNALECLILFA